MWRQEMAEKCPFVIGLRPPILASCNPYMNILRPGNIMDSRRLYDDLSLAEQDNCLDNEPFEVGETDDENEEREQPLHGDVALPWQPSGNFWTDAWYFVGPGWLVSIAYVDPGNYQADITAGGTTR